MDQKKKKNRENPRSPDITRMEYSLWGIVKNEFTVGELTVLERLNQRLRIEFKWLFSLNYMIKYVFPC